MKGIFTILGLAAIFTFVNRGRKFQDLQISFAGIDTDGDLIKTERIKLKLSVYNPNVSDVAPIGLKGNVYYQGKRIADIDEKFNGGKSFKARENSTFTTSIKLSLLTIGLQAAKILWDNIKGGKQKISTEFQVKGFLSFDTLKNLPFDTKLNLNQ